jgi:hypothetical protein
MTMAGIGKRRADVPRDAQRLAEDVSKADLLEAAWHLASLASATGADDDAATLERLRQELDTIRAGQGRKPLRPAR